MPLSVVFSSPLKKNKNKQLKKKAQFTGPGDWITIVLQALSGGAEARR